MKNTAVDGVIKALFEGEYENYIECLDVDCTSRRRENFYDIQVDVEGVGSLEESLERFVEEEILDGENLYEAEGFGKQRAKKGVRFQRFPPVVQFHLKRFQFNIQSMDMVKLNDHFTFPEKLDLSEFVSHGGKEDADQQMDKEGTEKYILHTVVIHQGDVHSGHYYAYIRPKPDSDWFRFDDEKVTLVSSSTAIEDNFGGHDYEVWDYLGNPDGEIPKRPKTHSAYILVYVREDQAQDLLSEPVPQEINPDLVAKYKRDVEMMNLQKRLRQDLNEHVRVQLMLSTSYSISPLCRPRSLGLHQNISSFPWNYIFKCPRDFSLSRFHSEIEKRFLDKKTAPADPAGGRALESHLFLLETCPEARGGAGGPLHHVGAGTGTGGLSSPGLSFYTCISSPGDGDGSGGQVPESQKGAAGILSRAIGFGAPSPGPGGMGRAGEETLLSELCRRYHRAGIWDSSCPTLYMCLYLDDISSLLMDRIPPSLPLISDGAYLERRQRVESKLRRWDEDGGGEVLLLLRYFDISDPRMGEICSKYTRTHEIPNLYNLGLVMVSQGTTLHDLNEYVAMEIDRELRPEGVSGNGSGPRAPLPAAGPPQHRAAAAAGQRVESDLLGQPGGRRNQQEERGAAKVTGGGGLVPQQQPVAPGGEDPEPPELHPPLPVHLGPSGRRVRPDHARNQPGHQLRDHGGDPKQQPRNRALLLEVPDQQSPPRPPGPPLARHQGLDPRLQPDPSGPQKHRPCEKRLQPAGRVAADALLPHPDAETRRLHRCCTPGPERLAVLRQDVAGHCDPGPGPQGPLLRQPEQEGQTGPRRDQHHRAPRRAQGKRADSGCVCGLFQGRAGLLSGGAGAAQQGGDGGRFGDTGLQGRARGVARGLSPWRGAPAGSRDQLRGNGAPELQAFRSQDKAAGKLPLLCWVFLPQRINKSVDVLHISGRLGVGLAGQLARFPMSGP
ncbi:ubiquitin carboxyl terminal hydrolase domain that is fused to a MATH domain [Cryptosporidium canis]|nr:ubiquitin carboxyl terminal hydrolase domain that is fused to a MATH domain [Cryptosporidium canis]